MNGRKDSDMDGCVNEKRKEETGWWWWWGGGQICAYFNLYFKFDFNAFLKEYAKGTSPVTWS